MVIAFDCDETLILNHEDGHQTPNYKGIELYKWFESQGHVMVIWSGAGTDYAKSIAEKLGLPYDEIRKKVKSVDIDIAVDDQFVELGTVNITIV